MFKKKFIKDKIKSRRNSFKYAFEGIISAFKSEANMKIHVLIMILVIIFGFVLKISIFEWLICVLLFSLVIGVELINTAIEETVNLASPNINKTAKLAKDLAAGAVLVFALGAIVIGCLIFIPKIIELF